MELLNRFQDIRTKPEFTDVTFVARIMSIRYLEAKEQNIVEFFDGNAYDRFIVYNSTPQDVGLLPVNEVCELVGTARGQKRRYFTLNGFTPKPVTLAMEKKYYPERFQVLTDEMTLAYTTSLLKIKDSTLRQFVGYCLGIPTTGYEPGPKQRKKYERFATSWASLRRHDAYNGGYVAHITGMLKILDCMEETYTTGYRSLQTTHMDWDILRAAVYLHDIGKPFTYQRTKDGRMLWREGAALNHTEAGICYLSQCWERYGCKLEYTTFQKLLGIISEHMNYKGDATTPESSALRSIDALDAVFADNIKIGGNYA